MPETSPVFTVAVTESMPVAVIVAALRTITALDGLSEDEYIWLATHGTERKGSDGALVFTDGAVADRMTLILKGEIQVRRTSGKSVFLWVGRAGQMTGKLPYSRMKTFGGDGFSIGSTWVLDIHEDLFPAMLAAIPSMAQRCVSALLDRVREFTRIEQQSEKLAALGKLAANLAHELNNPASAAQRSASSLFAELRQFGDQKYRLGNLGLSDALTAKYSEWVACARAGMKDSEVQGSALAESDRELKLIGWLESHCIADHWAIAPALAETGIETARLDELAERMPPEALPVAVATVAGTLRVERMVETIVNSTVRIFDLIRAIKDYSYMDQAPMQVVNLAQSLENTLTMFKSRLSHIDVETEFDAALPPVAAYGSELNQVWTALIENALDALDSIHADGSGKTLRLSTRLSGPMAFVEIWNSGPGIPVEIRSRIFEPFFTTKAPGNGLGLGLDTAQRIVTKHSGYIHVESRPGSTCFQVRLPIEQAGVY
ncbi:MAG: ATP-binding protein [Acidobacteriaceae bacterium]|nr:ATP-binding protein [Acidobacteriaceae bacterium]